MPETLEKLRPDRDLQCYFFQPSAVAAISGASATGFTVSGTWRQQFDWAVIEWNRDNVFEHLAFRNLPDGDLSGLVLTYDESRENCIPFDSELYATEAWPELRIWAGDDNNAEPYFVRLNEEPYATAIEGSYQTAYADFTLSGTADPGDFIGLGYMGAHFTYEIQSGDTLESALEIVTLAIQGDPLLWAERTGATVRVYYVNGATNHLTAETGHNGNRFAIYSYSTGSAVWDAASKTLANGISPSKWRITLDFDNLMARPESQSTAAATAIPAGVMTKVRKMRWTYAADLQAGEFFRSEFAVEITNWTVSGTGRGYQVAGPGSRRIEENDPLIVRSGTWLDRGERGNYSGGMIQKTSTNGSSVSVTYSMPVTHTLYVGTRYTDNGATIGFEVDSVNEGELDLRIGGEDALIRWPVGQYPAGTHSLTITHDDTSGEDFYFDFVEMAVPASDLPTFASQPAITLATDWDTNHSLAIAPERTAWMLESMGYHGRHNFYVGALLFYELVNPVNEFATGTVTFGGTATPNSLVSVTLEIIDSEEVISSTVVERVIHAGDTPETIATSFANEFNNGYTSLWASVSGGVLTIQSRVLGLAGENITLVGATNDPTLTVASSGLDGAADGDWLTDLAASPRLNRAMRDWSISFFVALDAYGIDVASAFSTELKHGDKSSAAGIAQRGPGGEAIYLPTPAIQTNFSPTSLAFWKQVYLDCADLMDAAGVQPYLQFGEVQWWYFPNNGLGTTPPNAFSGMPFYDYWTKAEFQAQYGRPLPEFLDNDADPTLYPEETEFLQSVLGDFTDAIMAFVSATYPSARFEVLYPFDVNQTEFNKIINFPVASWTPSALDILKTEGLSMTFTRRLDQSEEGIDLGEPLGFSASQRSHLIGAGDPTSPWLKETRIAMGKKFESIVYFALDQYCLIGLPLPLPTARGRGLRMKR